MTTIKECNTMISKDGIDKVLSSAMPYVDGYQVRIEELFKASACSNFQGASAATLAMLQMIFTTSAPGEAKEDLDTLRAIVNAIFDKAEAKFPEWDEKRLKRFKEETAKAMSEFKIISETPKREAGDNIH
jgi:hypothetical protein